MPAAIIGGVIAGAGAIGAAAIGSKAQNKASQQATQAAQYATDQNAAMQRDIYNQNKGILAPYVQSGYGANALLNGFLGIETGGPASAYVAANDPNIGSVQGSPQKSQDAFRNYIANSDYGFVQQQGNNALNSGYAGSGTLQSGAAMKGLEAYRQNLQSGYRNEFMGYLGNQQGVGLSAGNALAGVGTNYATNMTANNNAMASVTANAALARAQGQAQLWGGVGNAFGQIGGVLAGRK